MLATAQFTISIINDGASGAKGDTGATISRSKEQWYLSTSNSELTGGTWDDIEPTTIPDGKYLWGRLAFTMTDGTIKYSDAVYRSVIGGVISEVDKANKSITDKVWQTDITNSINTYDGSTGKAIRDRVTATETSITGINTTISDVESYIGIDDSGATSENLTSRIHTAEDTASEHTRKISAVESTINNSTTGLSATYTLATQNANKFTWLISNSGSATATTFTLTSRVAELVGADLVIKDPDGNATVISGGKINANAITTKMLATDAIKSTNYQASSDANSPFSTQGTFFDLSTGNIKSKNFGIQGANAYINGTVNASAGHFGTNTENWNIETVYDYNMQPHASLVGTGDPYLQTGNWQVSNNAVATRKYTRTDATNGRADYYKDAGTNTFYDVGMKIPTVFTGYNNNDAVQDRFKKVFFYGRKYQGDTASQIDQAWTYFFMVDTDGNVYENGTKLSEKYASIDGVSGQYLPLSGGTVSGNLTVTGTLTATASAANKLVTTKTIRTNLGSTSSVIYTGETNVEPGVTGTLPVGHGGTGQTTAANAANYFINALGIGTSVPVDDDYFISQYVGGGTSNTTYYRRKISTIWNYINGKIQSTYDIPNTYRELTNNSFDTADITEAEIGDLLVTGSGRFANGLYGNLTGNVTGNLTGTASRATADADGNTIPDTYVKKAGDTLTGNLQYTMYGATRTPLNIYGGSSAGQGIAIGAGGAVIVGSGESAMLAVNNQSLSATSEILWLMSDNAIRFYTNCNTYADKVSAILNNSLQFYPEVGGTGALGTNSYPWATVYATNLHGALDGNASTATALATGVSIQVGNKTVNNWTGTSNLSFTMTDIAPVASESSDGWMEHSDKAKLNAITVTEGGGIEVGTIQGDRGITVTTDTSGQTTITTIAHTQSAISADWASGTNSATNLAFGATVTLPKIHYDVYGHITEKGTTSFKLPAAPTTITGNAGSATAFSSARTIALTGETIGSASSTGASGWSIATQNLGINAVKEDKTVANASNRATTINNNFHDGVLRYFIAGSSTQGRPLADARVLHMAWDQTGYDCQIALVNNDRSPLLKLRGSNSSGAFGDWIDVLGANNYTDYTVTKDGTGATGTWGISISGTANSAVSDGNGNTIATTYATKADPTFTGVLTAEAVKASSYVSVNPSKASTVGGLALYATTPTDYGIAMRGTNGQGVHGYVQGDWATYFTMNGNETTAPPRGWIFKNAQSGSGVASINCEGNMVLNGSITVGGNSTNTSGCRMVYDDTAKCLNFVFA